MPELPEVIVEGKRRLPFPVNTPLGFWEDYFRYRDAQHAAGQQVTDDPVDPAVAFLAPAAPKVVEEIVVKASKPQQLLTQAAKLPKGIGAATLGLLTWIGVGVSAVAMLEGARKRQQAEEDAIAKAEAERRRQQRLALEEDARVVEEIVTVGPRITGLEVAPYPIFPDPDMDPAFLPTVYPRTMPQPLPAVSPQVQPATPAPFVQPTIQPATVPAPMPTPSPTRPLPFAQPLPRVRPATQPGIRPGVSPQVRPLPFAQPIPSPAPSPTPIGLTGVGPSPLPSPVPQPLPMPQPQPQRDPRCKPCPSKKKRKQKRSQCWKKLVMEGRYPSRDRSYKWTRIDCDTGREI